MMSVLVTVNRNLLPSLAISPVSQSDRKDFISILRVVHTEGRVLNLEK